MSCRSATRGSRTRSRPHTGLTRTSPRPERRGARTAPARRSTCGARSATRLPEPRLFEVEIALDQPLDVLADLALVAQPEHGGALGADQLAPQVAVAQALLVDRLRRLLAADDGHTLAKARAVEVPEAPQRLLADAVLVLELVEPVERGLGSLQARDRLLGTPLARAGDTQRADQRRQRQALADERHQDHDE